MRKLMKYLKPYWYMIVILVVLVGVQVYGELSLPYIMQDIVNEGVMGASPNIDYIIKKGVEMLLYALMSTVAVINVNFLASKVAMGFGEKVRNVMFSKIQTFSTGETDKFGTASLITRTTNDVLQVQTLVYQTLRMMILAPMFFIGGLVFALRVNVQLTIVILIGAPLIAIVIAIISRFALPLFTSLQKKIDGVTKVARENLTGVRVIRAFNQQDREKERFNDVTVDLRNTVTKSNRVISALMPSVFLIMNIMTIVIVYVGGVNGVAAGSIMSVTQYASIIMFGLIMFSMLFVMIPRAIVSANRINEVLETECLIVEAEDVKEKDNAKAGSCEFRNVSFGFDGSEEKALSNISFISKRGETTAIIGSTGSGKSTLINLIARLNDSTEGDVIVSGVNVKDLSIDALRDSIGFVPQKANLFKGTIKTNMLNGKKDASDEEILNALEIAEAGTFVKSLDDGIDAFVAQGGTNFSGGQKQRLCIARAIVRQPEIYVFDDSFSALDYKTDKNLRLKLKNITKDSTVIIVAQRVSTIMDADNILVLENGQIVGSGKHGDLLESCTVYKEIVESQLQEEEM